MRGFRYDEMMDTVNAVKNQILIFENILVMA
jgi:hypothetical protein